MTKKRCSSSVLSVTLRRMRWRGRLEKKRHHKRRRQLPSTISDDDEKEEYDEDRSLLVRNVRRMYNKAKINNRRRWQGKEETKIICFDCQKSGHIIAECSDIKNKPSFSNKSKKPFKKKALKATWDSESESEDEVDMTKVCFMANDNTPKVISEPSLDDCDLTIDELGDAFVDFQIIMIF